MPTIFSKIVRKHCLHACDFFHVWARLAQNYQSDFLYIPHILRNPIGTKMCLRNQRHVFTTQCVKFRENNNFFLLLSFRGNPVLVQMGVYFQSSKECTFRNTFCWDEVSSVYDSKYHKELLLTYQSFQEDSAC